MCLFTEQTKPLIAEEDIVCYKIYYDSYGVLRTPWRNVPMPKKDEIITTDLEDKPFEGYVRFGYHSLEQLIDATFIASVLSNSWLSYSVVVKCVIPKGSKYYRGIFYFKGKEYSSYCSKSIKVIKNVLNCTE